MDANSNTDSALILNLTSETTSKHKKKKNAPQEKQTNIEINDVEMTILDPSNEEVEGNSNNIQKPFPVKKLSSGANKQGFTGHANKISSSLFNSNPVFLSLNLSNTDGRHEPLFSKKSFSDLQLHPHLISCLQNRLNIVTLTEIQEKTIPLLLENKDALVKSCTGSGKTLTYAIPIVQTLQAKRPKIKRSDGLFALIIVPTRELAIQSFECFSSLVNPFTWLVPGYLSGGEKKKVEKARIRKGINILISTPGRLLDHLETTSNLRLDSIEWLIIDEADRLLEQGFEESVLKIVKHCKEHRQTILLSATLTKAVENLAGMSMTNPVHIDASSKSEESELGKIVLPKNLKQYVVTVPSKLRLVALSTFILDKCLKNNFKAVVFMCTQSCVDFHFNLMSSTLAALLKEKDHKCKFFKLHGSMKQHDRVQIFTAFRKVREGILFCTDVAARGLDLPHVDWIIQYSAPNSVENYVHRVGRTARIGKRGNSLLFLLPSESQFSDVLQAHEVQLDEMHVNMLIQPILSFGDVIQKQTRKVLSVEAYATALQAKFETEVYAEDILHENAKEAFCSYVQAYATYPKEIRSVFPFKLLHLGHTAKSFCLKESPSNLGCKFAIPQKHFAAKKHSNDSRVPVKRKLTNNVSEFGSGLSELKELREKASKKMKISELE